MLREPGVWLVVVECFRPLVHLVQPLVQTFCWLVKDRLLLLLLVKCERRPGWWKQASVDGLRPVSLQMLCSTLHPASSSSRSASSSLSRFSGSGSSSQWRWIKRSSGLLAVAASPVTKLNHSHCVPLKISQLAEQL